MTCESQGVVRIMEKSQQRNGRRHFVQTVIALVVDLENAVKVQQMENWNGAVGNISLVLNVEPGVLDLHTSSHKQFLRFWLPVSNGGAKISCSTSPDMVQQMSFGVGVGWVTWSSCVRSFGRGSPSGCRVF